jgi:hypothetical protein
MKDQQFRVLGHEVIYKVPESSEEFNKLDPKRPDAACEEATNNIVYRSMNPDTRYWFLHGLSAEEIKKGAETNTALANAQPYEGVESEMEHLLEDVTLDKDETASRKTIVAKNSKGEVRMKDGVEVTKFSESEEVFYNRVIALAVKYKKFASEDVAREHFDPTIKRIASYVPFDVTQAERAERGPVRLAGKYKLAAAKSLALGTTEKLNGLFQPTIGKTFAATNDTTKMFTGKYPAKKADGSEEQVDFSVSDKDAEALGWLIKGYQDWKASQELAALTD